MSRRKRRNVEKHSWKGKSHKKGGARVKALRTYLDLKDFKTMDALKLTLLDAPESVPYLREAVRLDREDEEQCRKARSFE